MGDESPLLKGGKASSQVSIADLERGSVCKFARPMPPCSAVQSALI